VITKVLFSAAITLAAAVGAATPANADPSLFQVLSCNCEQPVTVDQTNLGIQNGLDYLQGIPGDR
jgi:hypothetical protein